MNDVDVRKGQRVQFTRAYLELAVRAGALPVPGTVLQCDTVSRAFVALVKFDGDAGAVWCQPKNLELVKEG